jgi:hypothetical protein
LPQFDEREEARAKKKQEELAPFIEQAMMRKTNIAPLAEDKIPSFVARGRQVAASGPQLTPEQEAARRRIFAAAQIPLENPEKASFAIDCMGRHLLRVCGPVSRCQPECVLTSIPRKLKTRGDAGAYRMGHFR